MAIERRALLVLGMHRSGTSALTRVLNLCGAALPSDLLPANSGNITGYWESPAVVRFNDRVLDVMGSPWDDPVWFSLDPLPAETSRAHAAELAALVASEFGDASLIVVKDPRLCRLMPIWREALALLEMQPLPILLLRNPLEAAASMRQRDNMPEGAGLLLWLQYVLAAELGSRGFQRTVLFYEDLLADCPAAVDRIESEFGSIFPARSPASDAEAVAFVSPALRHERAPDASLQTRGDISRWVRTVHEWFERARGGQVPADPAELDAVRAELAEAETLFGPSLRWRMGREQHAEALRWQAQLGAVEAFSRAQTQELESRLSAASAADLTWREQAQGLESRLAVAEADAAASREQVTALGYRLLAASAADVASQEQGHGIELRLVAAEAEAAAAREEATELASRLAAASDAAATLREDAVQLTSRLAAANANETALREQAQGLESQLAAVRADLGTLSARLRRIEATVWWRVWRRFAVSRDG